jgi:polar amino acid transport system substrate-binding protein
MVAALCGPDERRSRPRERGAVKHRRALLALVAFLSVAFLLAGRDRGTAQEHPKPLAGQTLRWGADCNGGIPYVIKIADKDKAAVDEPDGPVSGFEADLRDALARELGCRIVFKQLDFDNLYTELDQGNCDFAMNGLEIIPENLERASFTKPYYLYRLQLVVRADEKRFTTLEECLAQKLKVGTLSGCAAARILAKMGFVKDDTLKEYRDQDPLYRELRDRAVDAVLLDLPASIYYVMTYPQLRYAQPVKGLKFVGEPFGAGTYGLAVKKGNTQLLAHLNGALDRMRASGELKTILAKWDLWNLDQYQLYDVTASPQEAEVQPWTFDRYFPVLLHGAYWTIVISLFGFAVAMALGLPLSLMRLYGPWPLRLVGTVYVEFFRGIPVLLLLYFLYYGSGAFSFEWGMPWIKLNPYVAAVLGFGLNYAAYEAEIYRAGIGSIPVGQWEAAASLGMAAPLTFRRIILPQAVRVILPPMTNDFVALFKDTSIVSVIAVTELTTEYQILTKSGGGYVEIGLCTAALYLIMSVPLGYLSRYLEKRWVVKG